MKRSIRKKTYGIHVTYRDGEFSNNLLARNMTLEQNVDDITLGIDLTKSLRIQNKSSNTYLDALHFQENYENLGFMQLDSKIALEHLIQAWKASENPYLILCVQLSETGFISFEVKPKSESLNIQFNVIKVIDA